MSMDFYKHFSDVNKSDWHWPNFSPSEIASKREGELLVDFRSMDMLQELRYALNKPIHLNSAYRSEAHNEAVGGSSNSFHMKGMAFDIDFARGGYSRKELKDKAEEIGFRGIGDYNSFVHIDTRGRDAYWDER